MDRGLFVDHYDAFMGDSPITKSGLPLGVCTFGDEQAAFWEQATEDERCRHQQLFGHLVPPIYWATLQYLKQEALDLFEPSLSARWLLSQVYLHAMPEYPLSAQATSRCIADILIALSLEGSDDQKSRIEQALTKKFATIVAGSSVYPS